jgi:membrane protease YdiL (CAAX protease family)
MGVILGYVRVRYRSLTACILIHALFNGRTMLFAWLNPELVRSGW